MTGLKVIRKLTLNTNIIGLASLYRRTGFMTFFQCDPIQWATTSSMIYEYL
jgi:hypothetical protein